MGEVGHEKRIYIDPDICVSCGACMALCSFDAIEIVGEKYRICDERCVTCGRCLMRCPVGAIEESRTM